MSAASQTDEELITEIARGNALALAELYSRHAPRLLSFARRILKDEREGEDLLHDVFVEIWRLAGDFDPARGSVRAWLLLRLRSRGIDRLRRLQGRTKLGEREDETPISAQQPRLADGRRACSALDQLPPEKRQVLELGYFEGLSAQQIALQLGIPIGTVKSRTAAALAELRQKLGSGDTREVGS